MAKNNMEYDPEKLVAALEAFSRALGKSITKTFIPIEKLLAPLLQELAERRGWNDADEFGDRS